MDETHAQRHRSTHLPSDCDVHMIDPLDKDWFDMRTPEEQEDAAFAFLEGLIMLSVIAAIVSPSNAPRFIDGIKELPGIWEESDLSDGWADQRCQPIGCDNDIHIQGCPHLNGRCGYPVDPHRMVPRCERPAGHEGIHQD